ncbi:MAG: hypothetical protein E4G89_05020 [Methanothrix sp.]|nr:MAG: hypothetical protein E4G89_05020 [Methanothrix sp.]
MRYINKYAENLRRARADMLGTFDEEHYWECHAAAAEIDRLNGLVAYQKKGMSKAMSSDFETHPVGTKTLIESQAAEIESLTVDHDKWKVLFDKSFSTGLDLMEKITKLEADNAKLMANAIKHWERDDNEVESVTKMV